MLDYEWPKPSSIMFTGDEPTRDSDQTPQIFYQTFNQTLVNPNGFTTQHHHFHQTNTQTHFPSLYDPRVYRASYPPAMHSLEPVGGPDAGPTGFISPKSEPDGVDFTIRIGLNVGDYVNRLYHQSRQVEPRSLNSPLCKAKGCHADLTHAKHYHRRHKVCEFHSKASTAVVAGLTQRFCQQCSRFHILSEFDNGKRSCRKRLADHNRRRRKSQQPNQHHNNSQLLNAPNSLPENLARSPPDSGVHWSSLVTVAFSLDCYQQRPYQSATTSSVSTGSLFF